MVLPEGLAAWYPRYRAPRARGREISPVGDRLRHKVKAGDSIVGLFNKLFGGANGVRESMRDSYAQHIALVSSGRLGAPNGPHAAGLFGALSSRYRVTMRAPNEAEVWAELTPFLAMTVPESIAMLAEYVVFQEMPPAADRFALTSAINGSLSGTSDEDLLCLAGVALSVYDPAWRPLLSTEVRERIIEALSTCEQ